MKKLSLAALIFFAIPQLLPAQIQQVALLTKVPRLYEKTDWDISLVGKWDNPYLQEDVALNMFITTPSGKKLFLPCYYDSGFSGQPSLWIARFTPQETGEYTCYFQLLSKGEIVNSSKNLSFDVRPSGEKGFLHPESDWVFKFDNGTPFRGLGENIGWESRAHDDSKYFQDLNESPKYNYEYLLHQLADHGGNFFRTWMCRWNLPIDWKDNFNNNRYTPSPDYYNPSAVERMDWMIRIADSLHLHMMLTLGPGAYLIKDGGFAASAADFFVNPQSIVRYKNRLRYIIARWGYSPSIAAWELFNEVDNVMYEDPQHPIDAATIVKWHDEMSAYIKKIDPYDHMVTTSISYRDLPGLDTIKDIDFNQKHIYKNTVSIPATIVQYENGFHKPYVIGEYAYEWDWNKDFNSFAGHMDSDFKRGLWYGLFSPTPIIPMSWWWEYFNSRGTDAYIRRVRTILNQMLAAGNGHFDSVKVSVSSPGLQTFAVRCGRKIFVYVYNPTDTARTTAVNFSTNGNPPSAEVYHCESGRYNKITLFKISAQQMRIRTWFLPANTDVIFIATLSD